MSRGDGIWMDSIGTPLGGCLCKSQFLVCQVCNADDDTHCFVCDLSIKHINNATHCESGEAIWSMVRAASMPSPRDQPSLKEIPSQENIEDLVKETASIVSQPQSTLEANKQPLAIEPATNELSPQISNDNRANNEDAALNTFCQIAIDRTPLRCPDCRRLVFVSDFSKHIIIEHTKMAIRRIMPREHVHFFLDTRLARHGETKCRMCYLVKNKVTNLGSSEYKDLLPLLVMCTRIKLSEMCGVAPFDTGDEEFIMIWVTGIEPKLDPISISLLSVSRTSPGACATENTGQIYSIRGSFKPMDVYMSGRAMLLSPGDVAQLTLGNKYTLQFRLIVH